MCQAPEANVRHQTSIRHQTEREEAPKVVLSWPRLLYRQELLPPLNRARKQPKTVIGVVAHDWCDVHA